MMPRTPASPWRPASRVCVQGLLAVLTALECEVRGLPEWVLTRGDDDDRQQSAAVETSALETREHRSSF